MTEQIKDRLKWIDRERNEDLLHIPLWFVEMKAEAAEKMSEMEYRENGGCLDGNNYFYRYEALRGLIDDWEEYLGGSNRASTLKGT